MPPAASSGQSGQKHKECSQRHAFVELLRRIPPQQHSTNTRKPASQQQAAQQGRAPKRVNNRRGVVAIQEKVCVDANYNKKSRRRSDALENQRAVGAAKTKIVFHSEVDTRITGGIGAKIQIAQWVLIEQIDRGRDFLVVQGQHRED